MPPKINKKLMGVVQDKLKIGTRAIRYRIQKLQAQYPMTPNDAIYVIAQKEGISIAKYLEKNDNDTIDRVGSILRALSSSDTVKYDQAKKNSSKKSPGVKENVIVIGKDFNGTDPILPTNKLIEAKEMASIYPFLYVLENSIRELIDQLMISKFGDNWWDSEAPVKLKRDVETRMKDEEKDAWHQRRGARPIDYLDLKDLPRLMRKIEKDVVPNIFPTFEWFNQLVEEVYKSRCVVCHMNPLNQTNMDAVKLRFKHWQNQIKAKKKMISN